MEGLESIEKGRLCKEIPSIPKNSQKSDEERNCVKGKKVEKGGQKEKSEGERVAKSLVGLMCKRKEEEERRRAQKEVAWEAAVGGGDASSGCSRNSPNRVNVATILKASDHDMIDMEMSLPNSIRIEEVALDKDVHESLQNIHVHNPTNNIASGLGNSGLANTISRAQKNVGSGSKFETKKLVDPMQYEVHAGEKNKINANLKSGRRSWKHKTRTRYESTNSHEGELNEVRALTRKIGVMEIMDEGRLVSKRVKEGEDMNDFTNSVVGSARLTHHKP
ncbi:hypothetical protein GBA52_010246 [Prunus armeniaca]|nr:hypothetical protein GBA52_010246 [Prunus armeniaca]